MAEPTVDVLCQIVCGACGKTALISYHRAAVKRHMRCNRCVADAEKARRARRKAEGRPIPRSAERAKAYEAERSQRPEVRARRAAAMARYARDPLLRKRHEARWAVRHAVAAGRLVRIPCEVCGEPKSQGHHDDYDKPLDVRWLCRQHHDEHHARVGGSS